MRWLLVCSCVWAAGCTTEVVPVPGECEALVLREEFSSSVQARARLLVLADPGVPDDVHGGLDDLVGALRTGDVDADGEQDFSPMKEVELVTRVGALDGPLAPIVGAEVPTGWAADATLMFVVLATSSDVSPAAVDEAAALADVRDGGLEVVGLASCDSSAENLATLVGELETRGVPATLVDTCDPTWDGALLSFFVPRISSPLAGSCVPRDVDVLEDGRRACEVYETPLAGSPFDCTLPGRVADPTPANPSRCRIVQRVGEGTVPSEPGWYWDDFTDRATSMCGEGGQTISFTGGVELAEGARFELLCVTQSGECGGT